MSLENVLSRITGGKQLDLSASSYNKGSGSKKNTLDEVQGAFGGLGRYETIYLFWAFIPNESPLKMRVMLNNQLIEWMKAENIELEHNMRVKIVRLVMVGVQGSAFQPCNKCETTGTVLVPDPATNSTNVEICPKCGGLGKVSISKRKIAKLLDVPWSTYYKKKVYDDAYTYLMSVCAILEGNCFFHFGKKKNA